MRRALALASLLALVLLGWWVGGPGAQEGRAPPNAVAPGAAPPEEPAPEPPPPAVPATIQIHE